MAGAAIPRSYWKDLLSVIELPVSELWLVDVEGGKAKLDIIFDLCQRMIDNAGVPMKLYKTLDRREALKDAEDSQMTPEELAGQHITPSIVRLSIGTEYIDDIIDDLDQALTKV